MKNKSAKFIVKNWNSLIRLVDRLQIVYRITERTLSGIYDLPNVGKTDFGAIGFLSQSDNGACQLK